MRRVLEMSPTPISAANTGTAAERIRKAMKGFGEVLEPGDAEEPILAAQVRSAVSGWLSELRSKDELAAVGIKPRSTALLSGPPGCGKTTLAHHLAARLGVPLISIGSESIIESGLGDSERNMGRLFDVLDELKIPCVVFLDEIEALGAKRSTGRDSGGAVRAMNNTLTVMLRKIERFDGVMIGATNMAADLDPALWRRFGMQIVVDLPDDDARYAILKRYGHPFEFGDDTIEALTEMTDGAAPSLLRQLMEGVKRLLVIGDRIGRPMPDLASAVAVTIAQVQPHPEYEPPALWANPRLAASLVATSWPPVREA